MRSIARIAIKREVAAHPNPSRLREGLLKFSPQQPDNIDRLFALAQFESDLWALGGSGAADRSPWRSSSPTCALTRPRLAMRAGPAMAMLDDENLAIAAERPRKSHAAVGRCYHRG